MASGFVCNSVAILAIFTLYLASCLFSDKIFNLATSDFFSDVAEPLAIF